MTCPFITAEPDGWCVTVSGIQDSACSNCNAFNGTWYLTKVSPCEYTCDMPTQVCTGPYTTKIGLFFIIKDTIDLLFYHKGSLFPGSPTNAYELSGTSPFDGTINYVLPQLTPGYPLVGCVSWPSSLTIIPASGGTCGGDPHFIGFNGKQFEIQGKPEHYYNLISDFNVSVNAKFIAYSANPGTTHVGEVGIKVGTNDVGFTEISYNSNGVLTVNNEKTIFAKFATGFGEGQVCLTTDKKYEKLRKPFILGNILDAIVVDVGTYNLTIVRFQDTIAKHLNIFPTLKSGKIHNPNGIIGQTLFNEYTKGNDYIVNHLFDTKFCKLLTD